MKILITGATGLVGSALVSLLLQNGISIHYLTVSKNKLQDKLHYKGFLWNPRKGIIDENCLMGVDVIINLAGANISNRWTAKYKWEIIESRVLSAGLLFKIIKDNPNQVRQIISASATGIYPDSLTEVFTEEEKNSGDGFLANVVVKWEQSIDKFKMLNIKVCKLRTGLVLSGEGGALPQFVKPIKLGLAAAFGSGMQKQSWIHIDDLTAMYLFAAQQQWEGTYNAVAPGVVTNKQMTAAIARTLQKPYFLPGIPRFALKLLLGEMSEVLFSSQHVSAEKAIKDGFTFRYPALQPALEQLLLSEPQ